MKKKIGDDEEKFGDFPYFDTSIKIHPSLIHALEPRPQSSLPAAPRW
jgi:hypothetical protein